MTSGQPTAASTGTSPHAQVAVHPDTSRFWDLIVAAIAAIG